MLGAHLRLQAAPLLRGAPRRRAEDEDFQTSINNPGHHAEGIGGRGVRTVLTTYKIRNQVHLAKLKSQLN